jgi:hypothetical protein
VDKWTENHRPLSHSLYDYEGLKTSAGTAVTGGLIQTADGNWVGMDMPFTNLSGFF